MSADTTDSDLEELGGTTEDTSLSAEDIEPGETVGGELEYIINNVGRYDKPVVVMSVDDDVSAFWITDGTAGDIYDADLERGTAIEFERDSEESSFERDGEERTYHALTVRADLSE